MTQKNNQERNRQIAEMRAEGMTLQQIGDHFGISAPGVRYVLSKSLSQCIEDNKPPKTPKRVVKVLSAEAVPIKAQQKPLRKDELVELLCYTILEILRS